MNSPADPRLSPTGHDARRGLPVRWLVLLFLVALFGPCAIVQGPREVGRWKLAIALRERSAGEKEAAYATLQSARKWLPDSSEVLLQSAAWHSEDGNHELAIEDANRAVELDPNSWRSRMFRAHILQKAGKSAEAIADWKWIAMRSNATGDPPLPLALNGLAYAQAVAQQDLDQARAAVNKALQLEPGNPAILDTRGFIHYLQRRYTEALPDMDSAVAGMERDLAVTKRDGGEPVGFPQFADFSPERGVAVVRYHRALALLALGREKEANADLDRVRELIGGEPDDSLF